MLCGPNGANSARSPVQSSECLVVKHDDPPGSRAIGGFPHWRGAGCLSWVTSPDNPGTERTLVGMSTAGVATDSGPLSVDSWSEGAVQSLPWWTATLSGGSRVRKVPDPKSPMCGERSTALIVDSAADLPRPRSVRRTRPATSTDHGHAAAARWENHRREPDATMRRQPSTTLGRQAKLAIPSVG